MVVLAIAVFCGAAYAASFFEVIIVQSRAVQTWFTRILFAVLLVVLIHDHQGALQRIPRLWGVVLWIAWLNFFMYLLVLPMFGPGQRALWQAMANSLRLTTSEQLLDARASTANQLAIAVTLLLIGWFQTRKAASESG